MKRVLFWMGYVWALPTTMIGALIALASLSRPYANSEGALICEAGTWLKRILWPRWAAITFGGVVITLGQVSPSHQSDLELIKHELVHFKQARTFGVFFMPAYGLASLWVALRGLDIYRDNPFEVHARKLSGR